MKTYRNFVYGFSLFVALFILLNYLVWICCTKKLLADLNYGGDLARMGYVKWAKHSRPIVNDLPKSHIEQEDYAGQPVRVLTFGDSFTNGGGGGRNSFYQDYIASINNCNVLNIEPYADIDFITTIAIMCNNGYLDRIRPKYLLLSSSEKFCVPRFAGEPDFAKNICMEELQRHKKMGYQAGNKSAAHARDVSFINSGNCKFLLYSLLYHFSNRAFFSKVCQVNVAEPLFSTTTQKKLLFYREDVTAIPMANPGTVAKFNENLDKLADLLEKKGIKLYFMPVVDKYDLYSDYIVGNKMPKSVFFEELRKLERRYVLIDTKAILGEDVLRGEKDIFHADDTHWSWKASKKIFSTVPFN